MDWFNEQYLPSLFQRKKSYHGRAATFLTDKQADVCRRYMNERICNGDYGQFVIFEYTFNDKKIQLCEAGKYTVLYW